jgi:hypothetical protein
MWGEDVAAQALCEGIVASIFEGIAEDLDFSIER